MKREYGKRILIWKVEISKISFLAAGKACKALFDLIQARPFKRYAKTADSHWLEVKSIFLQIPAGTFCLHYRLLHTHSLCVLLTFPLTSCVPKFIFVAGVLTYPSRLYSIVRIEDGLSIAPSPPPPPFPTPRKVILYSNIFWDANIF